MKYVLIMITLLLQGCSDYNEMFVSTSLGMTVSCKTNGEPVECHTIDGKAYDIVWVQ